MFGLCNVWGIHTYTLKHTRSNIQGVRPSNIHAWGLQTYIHAYGLQTYIHTRSRNSNIHAYIHAWAIQTYIHTYMLKGFSKVPPLTQDRKSEQECSRKAFSSVVLNPKLFCEIRHTFIHVWGLQTCTLEAFKHTRLIACLKSMTGRGSLNIHAPSRAFWKAFR